MATTTARRTTLGGLHLAFLLMAAHATNDAFTNVLPAFLPTLQLRFGVGEAMLATFVAVVSLSANVMQAFLGALADRWGRRRSAALGLIGGSVLMSFIAVAPNAATLLVILAVGGLGSALFHPAAVSLVAGTGARRSLAVGLFAAGGPIGAALMPVVALAIIRRFGVEYVPWLGLLGVALGLALFYLTPRQAPPPRGARPKAFDLSLFRGPVGQLALAATFRAIAFVSFGNAVPLFLSNERGFAPDAAIIGATLALYSIGGSAGGLLAGALEGRLGRRRVVVVSMLLGLPTAAAVLFVAPGSVLYWLLVGLAGITTNAAIPLLVVSAQELAPHAVATASGMLMGFTWGTAGVLYIGFGALQQAVGLQPALLLAFAFLLPGAWLARRVLKRNAAALSG